MSDPESTKIFEGRKILALVALAGAAASAYGAGNYLAYAGTIYYTICAAAVILNYRRTALLLWAAVGAHAVLVGYGMWNWQTAQVIPCVYCFGAAGFALLAATVYTRLPAAIAPALLIAVVGYAWPYLFADSGQAGVIQQQTQSQTTEQQTGNQPVEAKSDTAGETGKADLATQPGSDTTQAETQQEQTAATIPTATNPDSQQGNTPNPNISGNVTPDVKPGSTTTEKPPEPAKPGSS